MPRRFHLQTLLRAPARCTIVIFGAFFLSSPTDARAEAELGRPSLSYEVRAQLFPPSIRLSHLETPNSYTDEQRLGLYFSPGLGFRLVGKEGHALLLDGDYRFHPNLAVSNDGRDFVSVRFGTAHIGYAYRYIARGPRNAWRRRRWAITPHIALAAGAAQKRDHETFSGIPNRSPVIGARAGVDFDVHVGRAFVGWSVSYRSIGWRMARIGSSVGSMDYHNAVEVSNLLD